MAHSSAVLRVGWGTGYCLPTARLAQVRLRAGEAEALHSHCAGTGGGLGGGRTGGFAVIRMLGLGALGRGQGPLVGTDFVGPQAGPRVETCCQCPAGLRSDFLKENQLSGPGMASGSADPKTLAGDLVQKQRAGRGGPVADCTTPGGAQEQGRHPRVPVQRMAQDGDFEVSREGRGGPTEGRSSTELRVT